MSSIADEEAGTCLDGILGIRSFLLSTKGNSSFCSKTHLVSLGSGNREYQLEVYQSRAGHGKMQ